MLNTPDTNDELAATQVMFGADFPKLAALFQKDCLQQLIALNAAIARRDTAQIILVAHTLSGSCASIGATGLGTACKTLEMQAKTKPSESMEANMKEIEAEHIKVEGKLQAMLQSSA